MGDLSEHFSLSEFRCKCGCGQVIVVPALIELLEYVREFSGFPIIITSGYRCPDHNAAVGGEPSSAHLTGEAADIAVHSDTERFAYLEAMFLYGIRRLGVYPSWLHLDVSQGLAQGVCWTPKKGDE